MSLNYTEEEKDLIAERARKLNTTPEILMSLNLPASIIDFISDEDLLNQITIVKGINIEKTDSEIIEESDKPADEINYEIQTDNKPFIDEVINETSQPSKTTKIKKPKTAKKEIKEENQINQSKSETSDEEFINNIKILDVSHMHAYQNFNKHFDYNVPTYEITLPQSGYSAKVRGLKADEIDMLRNSLEASEKSRRNRLSQIVYNCIVDTGLKSFSKNDFMQGTSVLDFDILLFGIMHQTFGSINDYSITCPHCAKSFNQKIITDTLIRVNSDEVGNEVSKIIKAPNKDTQFKNSLLNKFTKLIRIPDTDIVIEFRFSNLNRDSYLVDQLDGISDEERNTRKFYLTWVTNRLLLPQYDKDGNYIGSVYIDSPMEIFRIYDKIKSSSFKALIDEIGKIMDEHTITFGTPPIPCIHCNKEISSSKVEIVDYFLIEVYKEGL